MSTHRRRGFDSSLNNPVDRESFSSSVILKRNPAEQEGAKVTGEEGEDKIENQGHFKLSNLVHNAVQAVKIGVVASYFLAFCFGFSLLSVAKHTHFHSKLQDGLEVLGYRIKVEAIETAEDATVNTCTEDQPLVWGKENFLDADTFKAVRDCLTQHPLLEADYRPDGTYGSQSFAVHFLNSAVEKFASETRYSCGKVNPLLPFFHAAKRSDANGFVMRVLVCEQTSEPDTFCLDTHVDDTLLHNKVSLNSKNGQRKYD